MKTYKKKNVFFFFYLLCYSKYAIFSFLFFLLVFYYICMYYLLIHTFLMPVFKAMMKFCILICFSLMIFYNYRVIWHKVTRLVQPVKIKLIVFIYPIVMFSTKNKISKPSSNSRPSCQAHFMLILMWNHVFFP